MQACHHLCMNGNDSDVLFFFFWKDTLFNSSTTINFTILDVDNRPPWFQPCIKYESGDNIVCLSSGYTGRVTLNEKEVRDFNCLKKNQQLMRWQTNVDGVMLPETATWKVCHQSPPWLLSIMYIGIKLYTTIGNCACSHVCVAVSILWKGRLQLEAGHASRTFNSLRVELQLNWFDLKSKKLVTENHTHTYTH